MRNLKLCHSSHLSHTALCDTLCIATDPDSGDVYAVNASNQLVRISGSQLHVCSALPTSSDKHGVIGIEFIIERQVLCMIRSCGQILVYDPQNQTCEVAAVAPAGVCAASWSPDQDILLLAQDNHRLVAYTQFFELLSDTNLNPVEKGYAETVNVGWGSKETQFHGSEGKAAARLKQQETSSLLPGDDRKIRLSWRRDGQLFASSSIDPVKGIRVVRIWNRELELQYTSEVSDGLESCLCWKPSGEVIAVSQQRFQKHEISFIEKNGLFFSSFRLPFPAASFLISDVSWSSDSGVLAVWGKKENMFYLMYWSVNNNHWYLKQTMEFDEGKDSGIPKSIAWDPVDPLTMHIVFTDGTYSRFKYMWLVCRSNDATVAVIDGMEVLVTPFEKVVVPPPMSAWKVMSREFVNDVAFDSDSNLIMYTKSSSIIYTVREETSLSRTLNQIDAPLSVSLTEAVNPRANILRPVSWIDARLPDELQRLSLLVGTKHGYAAVSRDRSQTNSSLILWSAKKYVKLDLSHVVVALASDPCSQRVAVEFADGNVSAVETETGSISTWTDGAGTDVRFPQPCRVVQISCGNLFGLTDNFSLYRNSDLLLRTCCTSFLIHQNSFLVYTTTSHTLMLTSLKDMLTNGANEERKHPIERGSKLVTTTSSSAVMQTPRGNIEFVSPRPFLWLTIDSLMEKRSFLPVFKIMRKHRMNFNLLIDRYTELFMQSIPTFIDDVSSESMEYLVLFLTSLSEHVYRQPVRKPQDGDVDAGVSEVHAKDQKKDETRISICTKMRNILIGKKDSRFLHPLLLSYVICGEVDQALFHIIRCISEEEIRDKALAFLLYFVSVNDLFNEAIGTYDFDVVRMVALKSQKDPKEYLQMIQQLQSYQPEYYMKFKIDVSLGRFTRALGHVSDCDDERIMSEVLDLVQSRKLFKDAVTLLQNDGIRKKVWHKYADYLLSKKYYTESAIAYKKSGNRISAIRCHQLSGNWNQAISESLLLRDPGQLRTLCLSLIESLKSSGRRIEAAIIADKYLSDADSAVRILIEGCEWDAASRLMAQTQVSEQEQLFRQSLNNEADRLIGIFGAERGSLTRYVSRLLHIRKEKENQVEEQERFSDDAMSDVSSVRSISRRSGNSNKSLLTRASGSSSQKRDVRKWAKLKEGSRFEDVASVLACKEIIVRINNMQNDVSSLLRHLMEHDFTHAAQTCRHAFAELLQTAKSSIQAVWLDNLSTTFRIDQSDLTPEFDELISKPKISDVKWDLILL